MKLSIMLLLTALAPAQTTDWDARARADFASGRMRSAKAAFQRSADLNDGHPRAQAVALAGLAQAMMGLGEWSNARRTLEEALARRPDAPQIWHLLGQARLRTGDRAGAEIAIRKALELADSPAVEAACRADLATLFVSPGVSATEALHQAVAAAPPGQARARMLANLGILQWKAGRRRRATESLSQALAEMEAAVGPRHPDLAFILENYAAVLEKTGQGPEAHEAAARALELKSAFAWQANAAGATIDWNDLSAER